MALDSVVISIFLTVYILSTYYNKLLFIIMYIYLKSKYEWCLNEFSVTAQEVIAISVNSLLLFSISTETELFRVNLF